MFRKKFIKNSKLVTSQILKRYHMIIFIIHNAKITF